MSSVAAEPATQAKYAPGDRVRVMRAYPLGHLRTPYYIRGCTGTIERLCGRFPNPEELAQQRSGLPAVPLYRVRFAQKDVWPEYRGNAADALEVEIFEHWLDPA
jgi:nitrile hydratase